MACCGGGGPRPQLVRKQIVNVEPTTTQPIQRKVSRRTTTANIQRQYVMPREQCTKCGYPGMLVIIAGRERMQCSNVNCRLLID